MKIYRINLESHALKAKPEIQELGQRTLQQTQDTQ